MEEIKITAISDDDVTISVRLSKLKADFSSKQFSFEFDLIKKPTHPLLSTTSEPKHRIVNNNLRVKVFNADGSPSMIHVEDLGGEPMYYEEVEAQPIYETRIDENGEAIEEIVGYTEPVIAPVMEQETIGQFEYYKIKYQEMINEMVQSAVAAFDPDASFELSYTKSE